MDNLWMISMCCGVRRERRLVLREEKEGVYVGEVNCRGEVVSKNARDKRVSGTKGDFQVQVKARLRLQIGIGEASGIFSAVQFEEGKASILVV